MPLCSGAADYNWKASVFDGLVNAPESWTENVVPGNGDSGTFRNNSITSPSEYTVQIPEGGLVDGAATYINGLPSGTKITFDATGTTWTKMRSADSTWPGKIFRFDNADHIFNLEGIDAGDATKDPFGFTLTDGKISFAADSNGDRLVFESGTFNNAFLPDGETPARHSTILMYSVHRANSIVELRGGTHKLQSIEVRGQTPNGKLLVSGGEHSVYNGVTVNNYGALVNGVSPDGVIHVSGGKLTVESGNLKVGNNQNGRGIVQVDGNGVFFKQGGTTYAPDTANATGIVYVAGNGTYATTDPICAGHKNYSFAEFDVRGNGRFLVTNILNLAEGEKYSSSSLTLAENGYAYVQSLLGAGGEGRKAEVSLSDNATLEIGKIELGSHAQSEVTFSMTGGHLVQTSGNYSLFGNNSGGKVNFGISGGDVSDGEGNPANTVWIFEGGRDSTAEISGGDVKVASFAIEGKQKSDADLLTDWTNTVRQTGGTVTVSGGANTGFDIRGNKRNAMYLLEDGMLNVNSMYFRLGHGGANEGYHAVFRQTGGEFHLENGNGINFCDAGGSDGEAEFLGGVSYVHNLRGWNGCNYRGGTGKARCYFNGGTIRPQKDDITLIYTMSECALGPVGGVFDTYGLNSKIRAKFQNDGAGTEGEVKGKFVKAGAGTLTMQMKETSADAKGDFAGASLNSYHAYTQVDNGTLLLTGAADVAFGRDVTVKGGATLSIAGDAATLTVDSLSLGDGHGFAVLVLDAGDTVVVEAANGVTADCGAIDVPWKSTDGTYAVFTCKQGVQPGELDKIAVYNADTTKDYAWTTEVDGETGYTICSVVVASKGTLTKTITYSDGAVTTNGTGKVSGIVAAATGTQSGEISLASTAAVSVEADQTMTLSGPLVGTGVALTKTGAGKLVVDGSNPDFYGSFIADGGLLEVLSPAALGTNPLYFPLVLGGGTFLYSGSDPVVFNGALRIAAPEHMRPVVIDNVGDMTFTSTEYVQGLFIKKGVGTLTLDLPAGTFAIGSGDNEENIGENGGEIDFPASGDTTTSSSGLYGVNILEGTMKVVGQGIDKTTLETRNTANVGGGYKGEVAAILDVENARINWGAGSRHGCLCRDVPAGTPAPEIHLNNAYMWSDSPTIGRYSFDPNMTAKLIMTNSTFYGHYNAAIGGEMVAVKIDANDSKLYSNGEIGWAVETKRLEADFYGAEALMGSINTAKSNNNAGLFNFNNRVTGELKLRDGATLQTTRGVKMNGATLDVVFDGGKFEILAHDTETETASTWTAEKGVGFKATGDGLELAIADGFTHSFNFPIYGDGKVVKTGEGTFKLVTARAEGEKLIQYTGGTVVSNGTFVIDGSLVAGGAKSFDVAEGAILDLNGSALDGATISGAGVVTNGTLSAATIAYDEDALPTFSDVEFEGTLFVDFGQTAENPLDMAAAKAGIVVAHYTGEAPANLRVKSVNTGIERARTAVVCEGGDVIAKMTQSGFSVRIR